MLGLLMYEHMLNVTNIDISNTQSLCLSRKKTTSLVWRLVEMVYLKMFTLRTTFFCIHSMNSHVYILSLCGIVLSIWLRFSATKILLLGKLSIVWYLQTISNQKSSVEKCSCEMSLTFFFRIWLVQGIIVSTGTETRQILFSYAGNGKKNK